MNDNYRTDELENAIDYLEKASLFYSDINYQHRFKWLMVALHGALYGFGILAIKGSNPSATVYKSLDGQINKRVLAEMRDDISKKYGEDDPGYIDMFIYPAKGKLLDIRSVLERCQDDQFMLKYTESRSLVLTQAELDAIEKMIDYRNQFAHFKPMAYVITGSEEEILKPVFRVIKFLALECNNILYYGESSKARVEKAIDMMVLPLSSRQMEKSYAASAHRYSIGARCLSLA
ncbi:hypothetical protein [Paenibacillus amylolyticus]|uniref:hypothetical protein n=1 Tax=Paenibacillus amylolyticus TaxID=1451 RepID=UPI000FD6D9B0|nr:hypothetical protein [Paenibacillus amylolyticus]